MSVSGRRATTLLVLVWCQVLSLACFGELWILTWRATGNGPEMQSLLNSTTTHTHTLTHTSPFFFSRPTLAKKRRHGNLEGSHYHPITFIAIMEWRCSRMVSKYVYVLHMYMYVGEGFVCKSRHALERMCVCLCVTGGVRDRVRFPVKP